MFFWDASFRLLGAIRVPKATEKMLKWSPNSRKGGPKAHCGTCQKHGRHCTGGTWGGAGEGPGISFFRNAVRRLPQTLPRRVWDDFL